MTNSDLRMATRYVAILVATWLVGTALVLVASVQASTVPAMPITAAYLAQLHNAWGWYAAAYSVLFVTDGGIALLGVMLWAWLRPSSGLVAGMVIALFVLSGVLGLMDDVAMVAAVQVFRDGSAMLAPELAGAFLDGLNVSTNWTSAASIFPGGIAALIVVSAARYGDIRVELSSRWIAYTRLLGIYQIVLGFGCVFALLSQNPLALNLAVTGAAILVPVLCIPWLLWTLQKMHKSAASSIQISQHKELS